MTFIHKPDTDLLISISKRLLSKKESVSVAESVTAGLLQFLFSNAPDAARFFQGGITAYNLGQKSRHLHIEPLHAEEVNCVSNRVAIELARGAIQLFNSDWALAITGYASPVPASGNEVYAYYAIIHHDEIIKEGRIIPTAEEPVDRQQEYANQLLIEFSKLL
jgi:nicotinamide-nucleotide amidase